MDFSEEKIIGILPKSKNSDIVVRTEKNEFGEDVLDIRLRQKSAGSWIFTRHGLTFPIGLTPLLVDALKLV